MELRPEDDKARRDFLIAMYNQLMADINRHIIVIWQSVGVLFGTFAALSLVEKGTIPLDFAATLIIVVCIWVVSHVIEAGYWYNRNLVMIANIERIFLVESDLRDVHYYFGAHRKTGRLITHLRIQRNLAIGITVLILGIHYSQVIHAVVTCVRPLELTNTFPWIAAAIGVFVWIKMVRDTDEKYREFLKNSPGRSINTSSIQYGGRGHPTDAA
jgi:hypothetical protein